MEYSKITSGTLACKFAVRSLISNFGAKGKEESKAKKRKRERSRNREREGKG